MAQQEKSLNEILQIRRQKLADLQAAGKDPFQITKFDQTHHADDVRNNIDQLEVVIGTDEEGKSIIPEMSEIPAEKIVTLAGRIMF